MKIPSLNTQPPPRKMDTKVGKFYMIFMDETEGRESYSVCEEAFSSEEDALRTASKKTNLRSQLLSFCQVTKGKRMPVRDRGGGGEVHNSAYCSIDSALIIFPLVPDWWCHSLCW